MAKVLNKISQFKWVQPVKRWAHYSLHLSKEDQNAPKLFNFCRWIVSTGFAAILGVVVLAAFFSLLAMFFPGSYRFLTRWVNQPPVPATKYCAFSVLDDVNNGQSEALKFLKWYDVKFKLDTSVGNQSLAVAYADDFHLAVYSHGHRQKPKETDPVHLFIGKTNFKSGEFFLTVVHDSSDGVLDKLEYSNEECPIHLEFFGGTR